MAEHENSIGETSEWYTPREIFRGAGLALRSRPVLAGPGALGAGAIKDLHQGRRRLEAALARLACS